MSWVEQEGLVPSDPEYYELFGYSVSIYGDTAVVAAPFRDISGTDTGKVYIFVRNGTTWIQQAELVPSISQSFTQFGYSVSIYKDTVIIGSPFKDTYIPNSGKAYIFFRTGTTWAQQAELIPSDPENYGWFGASVSIYEDTVIIGSPYKDGSGGNSGKAYIFVRTGTTWIQQAGLIPNDPQDYSQFGNSVSIYKDTVIIGELYGDASGTIYDSGKAYIFVRTGINWAQQAELIPSSPDFGELFGYSVSIYEDTVIIGTPLNDASGGNSGKAYIFIRTGTSWIQDSELVPINSQVNGNFGNSVSIYKNSIVVGEKFNDASGDNSGKAYIFVRSGTTWTQQAELIPSDPEAFANFGWSVSNYEDTVIIGALYKNIIIQYVGKAYIFQFETPQIADQALEEQCICSQKPCAQLSYTGVTESDKITNIADNRAIATSYIRNNVPYNVRGRQFLSYSDYIRYQQAQLKFY